MRILRDPGAGDSAGGGGNAPAVMAYDVKTMAPAEFASEPSLANIKSVQDLTKGYINAQKLIGAKRIALPGEKASDAEWGQFYDSIGRPKTSTEYEMPDVKVDESLKIDDKRLAAAKQKFHDMGLTPRQAKELMSYYMGTMNEQVTGVKTQAATQAAAAVDALKQEWGEKYELNVEVAKSVLKKYGDQELLTYLDTSGMGNNTKLITLLHKIGVSVMEDRQRGGKGGNNPLNLNDQARATQEIETLKTDVEFQKALNDARSPAHKGAVQRWTSLFAVAHPGKEQD